MNKNIYNKTCREKIFLEECNDGLVKIFEDKISELKNDIKYLSRREIKKYKEDWTILIKPEIEKLEKEISRFKWRIKRIIVYDQKKIENKYINVEELLDQIDIIDLIKNYTELKNIGKGYKGLCPLHNEKTPSFHASREKGVFHCFGCGESGNAISFIMKIEHLDFKKTINYLKEIYG